MPAGRSARHWPPIICTRRRRVCRPTRSTRCRGVYLGPAFSQAEIERRLSEAGRQFEVMEEPELLDATTTALVEEKAVGWFQGRMEFGPRALGNRSILADPRSPSMQKTLNLRVKYRESFRPFAPSVLCEDVQDWFEIECRQPVYAARRRCRERSAPRDDR